MLHCEVDRFETWSSTALELIGKGVPPASVRWEQVPRRGPFFGYAAAADRSSAANAETETAEPLWHARPERLPRLLLERVEKAACHADPGKWELFYRLAWQMARGEHALLKNRADADVRRLTQLRREVTAAVERLEREVVFYERLPGAPDYRLAWYRPGHAILPLAAPHFVRKFLLSKWALLTPDESVEWDSRVLQFGPGAPLHGEPRPEDLVAAWRSGQRSSFRADRLTLHGSSAGGPQLPRGRRAPLVFVIATDSAEPDGRAAAQILAEALTDVGIDLRAATTLALPARLPQTTAGTPRAAERPRLAESRRRWAAELDRLRPQMLVTLGAAAAQALLGRDFRVSRQHGQVFASPWAPWTMATYHPAALVRVPDLTVRARMQEQFLYDLHRIAEALAQHQLGHGALAQRESVDAGHLPGAPR